jgi:hypothetical protein
MKTHEHALISVGYAATVSLLAGEGLADPGLYLTALLGGEILDLVDHPLYHLIYRRSEPHVVEARQILRSRGLRAALAYLDQVEQERLFKGLLLHNFYALTLVVLASGLAAVFLAAPVYFFVFLGALLLHMLTDIYGDFARCGHCDNWLWPLSDRLLDFFGRLGGPLVTLVMVWGALVQVGFFLVTFRWAWQLSHPVAAEGLASELAARGAGWLASLPLVCLTAYYLSLFTLCAAGAHKYGLEMRASGKAKNPPFQLGSLGLLRNFLLGRRPRTSLEAERTLLRMQADQGVWILVLAGLIVSILMAATWIDNGRNLPHTDFVLVLTPVFLALLFGTFIHTTVGEFGGVLGVLMAWLLNFILSRLGWQPLWPLYRGYLLFGAAAGAWILGLLGGMILKGQSRMSIVTFSIRARRCPQDATDDAWLNEALELARSSLEMGYRRMHACLYGRVCNRTFMRRPATSLMLTPYQGRPLLGDDTHHLQANDAYAPVLRELAYTLCDNHLTSRTPPGGSSLSGEHGLLPILPRYRKAGPDRTDADMDWQDGVYHWRSRRRPFNLHIASRPVPGATPGACLTLVKTWSEFIDHAFTRKSTLRTDLFLYPEADDPDCLTLSGVTREITSTKEYATVEAEAYAGAVMGALLEGLQASTCLEPLQYASARLFYPRVSIYDQEMLDWAEGQAALLSDRGGFPRRDFMFLRQSLEALPVKNLLPSATADFGKRLLVLAGQYAIAALSAAAGLDPLLIESLLGL